MSVTDEQLQKLAPYLAGGTPDPRGEIDMYCPLHPDTRRSASLNVNMGAWYCHAGCGGGSVRRLIDAEDTWVSAEGRVKAAGPRQARRLSASQVGIDVTKAKEWHKRLRRDNFALAWLGENRGITLQTVKKARIGWDGCHYKIPVFSPERELWNIRTYDPHPAEGRRKIWGVRDHNAPRLYPIGVVERAQPGSAIIVCEGEWDALLTLQVGYQAVTRTGAAKVWHDEWSPLFASLRVFVCHDRDEAGRLGDQRVSESLEEYADEVKVCRLPYKRTPKHGKDLTDFILDHRDNPGLAVGKLLEDAK